MEFEEFKNSKKFKNCFRILELQESFTTYRWVIMYMMYDEKL
jgi:hypothetical protein